MGDRTGIEWSDATWKPIVGCTRGSAGCDNCYAANLVDQRPYPAALASPVGCQSAAHDQELQRVTVAATRCGKR